MTTFPDFDLTNKNKRKKERRKNKPKKVQSDTEDVTIDPELARDHRMALYEKKLVKTVDLWKDRLALIDPYLFREERIQNTPKAEREI